MFLMEGPLLDYVLTWPSLGTHIDTHTHTYTHTKDVREKWEGGRERERDLVLFSFIKNTNLVMRASPS